MAAGTGVLGNGPVVRRSPERIETGIDDLSLAEIRKGEYVSQLNCCELFASLEQLKIAATQAIRWS
jgi:hypothetical protein